MSDFFYKERLGPVFSPVINIKNEKLSPTVVSAIDNLLSPSGNMFTRAAAVKNLMSIEKLGLEETARVLSLKKTDVANKLRLLEFSQKERSAILEYGFSESGALEFLKLDKVTRLYTIEYCRKSGFDENEIKEYVDGVVATKSAKKEKTKERAESVKKFIVSDIGFFLNSIENATRLARNAGFDVKNEKTEHKGGYDIHISIKKMGYEKSSVDKKDGGEYNV